MSSMDFEYTGLDELISAIRKAESRFPYYVEEALKKEARSLARLSKKRYAAAIKQRKSTTNPLEKSFRPGRVLKKGDSFTDAVLSKAPHYYIVEEGHEASGWYKKQRNAQRVRGKKVIARMMLEESNSSEKIAERILENTLKEAGLS